MSQKIGLRLETGPAKATSLGKDPMAKFVSIELVRVACRESTSSSVTYQFFFGVIPRHMFVEGSS